MLFHVTLRHKPVDCPGRNPDKARASRVHFADRDARQRELGYKMRAFVGAWPSHEYALIKAPDLAAVQRWIGTLPNEDMDTITPVGRMADLINQSSAEATTEPSGGNGLVSGNGILFHLTMEHAAEHCPTQNSDLIRGLRERYEQRAQRSKETGTRVHFFVSAEPSHVTYALVEAQSVESVRRWLMRYPVPQDVMVTPVQRMAVLLSN